MEGIVIRYEYDGDEAAWRSAVDTFIEAVKADAEIAGKFHYAVNKAGDGKTRIHVGRWDKEETVKTVQSRDYFKTFSQAVQKLGGESLTPTRVSLYRETA